MRLKKIDKYVLKQTIKGYGGVNMSNIKELQRSDDNLMNIVAYLESNILPESQKDSRRIFIRIMVNHAQLSEFVE
jgi:hypothetical protein